VTSFELKPPADMKHSTNLGFREMFSALADPTVGFSTKRHSGGVSYSSKSTLILQGRLQIIRPICRELIFTDILCSNLPLAHTLTHYTALCVYVYVRIENPNMTCIFQSGAKEALPVSMTRFHVCSNLNSSSASSTRRNRQTDVRA